MATSASPDRPRSVPRTAPDGGSTDLVVGLDVGTTSAKSVVPTAHDTPVATGRADTPWLTTAEGAEVDVRDLDRAVLDTLAEALRGAPRRARSGTRVTSVGESGVLLDGRGESVAPVVAWYDAGDLPRRPSSPRRWGPTRSPSHSG